MKTASMALVVATLIASTGCSTLVKEGVGLFKGSKGVYAEVQQVDSTPGARPLGEYTRFELGSFSDEYNQLPPGFMTMVQAKFREKLAQSPLPPRTSGKTLRLEGDVLYFEMTDMIDKAFGPLEEVIVRTRMVDAQTGRVLGIATCIGRSTNRVNLGVEKKADGLAKAFVNWILENHPAGATE